MSFLWEGFVYRHGVAALITLRLLESVSLADAVKKASASRWSGDYAVTWSDGSAGQYSLSSLAARILDDLIAEALGEAGEKGLSFADDPFSISTVIEGGSAYQDMPVDQSGEIHRALEVLSNWTDTWSSSNPPQLNQHKFEIKNKQDNHFLYGGKQGARCLVS